MKNLITDLSTLLGILAAYSFIIFAMSMGGNVLGFLDIPSVLIVVLGTSALTAASFTFRDLLLSQKLVAKTILYPFEDPKEAARKSMEVAETARKKGVLGLQNYGDLISHNSFFAKGINLVIDGTPPEEVEKILALELNSKMDRHNRSTAVLKKAAEISPAMGLIGTLIGLIQMLGKLDDPSSIGPAMAVALLTTFYGALLAYTIFLPLASKLERNSSSEALVLKIYLRSVSSIAKKENPRRLEEMLNSILPPTRRIRYFS